MKWTDLEIDAVRLVETALMSRRGRERRQRRRRVVTRRHRRLQVHSRWPVRRAQIRQRLAHQTAHFLFSALKTFQSTVSNFNLQCCPVLPNVNSDFILDYATYPSPRQPFPDARHSKFLIANPPIRFSRVKYLKKIEKSYSVCVHLLFPGE